MTNISRFFRFLNEWFDGTVRLSYDKLIEEYITRSYVQL